MAEFDENDLVYSNYENNTTAGDDPTYTATRDRDRVNKKNAMKSYTSAKLL